MNDNSTAIGNPRWICDCSLIRLLQIVVLEPYLRPLNEVSQVSDQIR